MPVSIKHFVSYRSAKSTASCNLEGSVTLLIPTEDPRRAGLTKRVFPNVELCPCFSLSSFRLPIATHGATGMRSFSQSDLVIALSMHIQELPQVEPTYGTWAISKSPWGRPSSP